MTHRGDLNAALRFVHRRIEEEATRSGEALSSDERFLLDHLPTNSAVPQPYEASPAVIVPRDKVYERLCRVAKAAYHYDLRLNATSANEWQYAAAITELNRHPMFWLLEWAGVKERSRSLDRWLLWASGFTVVIVLLPLIFLLASSPNPKPTQWAGALIGLLALVGLLQFASRRVVNRRLLRIINRARSPDFLAR